MRYLPHTPQDIREMLTAIGVKDIDALFECIPKELRLGKEPLDLPAGLSENELTSVLRRMQKRNADGENASLFLGAGAYRHFCPAFVDHLIQRGEFATSYTPYQPEVSQGTLQAIYEFQTLVSMLTGMDIANASMYDGASALAEAALMANRINSNKEILISRAVHPQYRQVVQTYIRGTNIQLIEVPFDSDGKTDLDFIRSRLGGETCAVVIQNPNFFGVVESVKTLGQELAELDALLIVSVVETVSLGILKSPGERGADIVTGEGQSFGLPVSYGGPYLGLFATRQKFLRQMPGRLAGETTDREGRRAYALTLATREQHIRRERATSNICTNQGLCALAATIYLAAMGKQGLRELAILNLRKADYLKNKLAKVKGFKIRFGADTFNEFVLECPGPVEEIQASLRQENIIAGLNLETSYPEMKNCLLLCVTELNTREEMDRLAQKLEAM